MKGDRALSEEETIADVRGYFEHEVKEAKSHLLAPRRAARQTRSVPRGLASLAMLAIVAIVVGTAMRVVVLAPGTSATPSAVASETPPTATPVVSPSSSLTGAPSNPPGGPMPGDLPGSGHSLRFVGVDAAGQRSLGVQ